MAEELQLRDATKELRLATMELQKFNQSTAAEIGKLVGKDLQSVTEKFTAGFMQVPGVQTLGAVGKTLFDRGFAALKQKRELRALADQLGLNDKQLEQLKFNKKVQDAQQKANAELQKGAKEFFGISVKIPEELSSQSALVLDQGLKEFVDQNGETVRKIDEFIGVQSDDVKNEMVRQTEILQSNDALLKSQDEEFQLSKQNQKLMDTNTQILDGIGTAMEDMGATQEDIKQANLQNFSGNKAREREVANEEARAQKKQETLLGGIVKGVNSLSDNLLKGLQGLKDKGLMGLLGTFGIAAGLFAAPFIAISSFFTQLALEVKVLDGLLKGGLSKFFSPLVKFFKGVEDIFSKAGTGQFLKGDTIKLFGKYADDISLFIGRIKAVFAPLMNAAKGSASFMAGFQPIAKFAATIGRTLGKIFLPITILMSIFDGVTGFIRGFKEDGILGGIKEAVIGVVDGFVGGLIRMVTGAFAFLLELIGLDNFAASLKENVSDAIEGVYEIFRGVVDIITFPFRLAFEAVKGIFGFGTDFGGLFAGLGESIMGIFDGVINIITAPFDMIFGLIKDVFSFVGFELPDFDIGETILGFVSQAYDFVKGKIKGFFSFLGFGGDDLEAEVSEARDAQNELARAGAVSADGRARATVRRNGVLDVQASEARLAARGFQVATEEQRAALQEAAAARTAAAQQALEDFLNAPKLSDAIGKVKEKMGEVFTSISNSVSAGFTSAVSFVTDLFTFSEEDATAAGIATKLIDIVFAPYNLAVNFFKGIFGFGEDEQGQMQPFSIGELVMAGVNKIVEFFTNILDFDFAEIIKKIPGAGAILDFLGFGDEGTIAQQIKEAEDRIARSEAGENVYFGGEAGGRNRDRQEIERLLQEQREMDTEGGVAPVIIQDNSSRVTTSTSSSTVQMRPVRDVSPPTGTVATVGVF